MRHDSSISRLAAAILLLVVAACANEVAAPLSKSERPALHASRGMKGTDGRALGAGTAANGNANGTANGNASANATGVRGGPAEPNPVSCTGRRAVTSSGTFGPAGGILLFGQSSLVIPGGALRDTITISATVLDDGTSTVVFQPHGLHFYKPVGLVLDGTGCTFPSDETASVVYLGDDGQVLESIPAYYDPHWKAVAAPIMHFSGYAIAFRE
jgi:hypothetical protein